MTEERTINADFQRRPVLSASHLAGYCLVALLALTYLGCAPDVILSHTQVLDGNYDLGTLAAASNGDNLRQLEFLVLFSVTGWVAFRTQGPAALLDVPRMLVPVLAWCWLSLSWSIDPGVSLRRVAFTTILVMNVSWITRFISFEDIIRWLVGILVVLVLADWVAVMVLPLAVHQSSALDKALIGNWRGLQNHKNEAGAMCAIAVIVFAHEMIRLRSYFTAGIMIVAAALFLYQTHSKTSGTMVLIALAAGAGARAGFRHPMARNIVLGLIAAIALLGFSLYGGPTISGLTTVLDDPGSLTGRTQIWPVLLEYAADHPFLGAGYGSFFAIGSASPIFEYGSGWVTTVDHAHNGYLDLLVQIGGIGLALVIYTLVLRPCYWLLFMPIPQHGARSLITAIFTFAYLHDLLETSLLERDTSTWVLLLIMYCSLEKLIIDRKVPLGVPQMISLGVAAQHEPLS